MIRIECPRKFEDDFWDSVHNAMKLGDTWSPSSFDGCSAKLCGIALDRINMARVVATT